MSVNYCKFRKTLRDALENKVVSFRPNTIYKYENKKVYRMVYRPGKIRDSDFDSQMEKKILQNNPRALDERDIANYSCSFFTNKITLKNSMKTPPSNKRIFQGDINETFGCIEIEGKHIHCYIYEGADLKPHFTPIPIVGE